MKDMQIPANVHLIGPHSAKTALTNAMDAAERGDLEKTKEWIATADFRVSDHVRECSQNWLKVHRGEYDE